MFEKKEVARHLLRQLPDSVLRRVFQDDQFRSFWEGNGFTILGERFSYSQISDSLDLTSRASRCEEVSAISGKKFSLKVVEDQVFLSHESNEVQIEELSLLLPEPKARLVALYRLSENCFPSLGGNPITSELLSERKPTESELIRFMIGAANSPSQVILTLFQKMQANESLTTDDFIPDFVGYFHSICGLAPEDMNVEAWSSTLFVPYWKEVISKNKLEGLRYLMFVGLLSPMDVTAILDGLDPLELAQCFTLLQDSHCPFIHVGITKISKLKITEKPSDLPKIASKSMDWLVSSFSEADENYVSWRIVSAFFCMTLEKMSSIEGLSNSPVYWRRLAAFTHANLMVDLIFSLNLNIDELLIWVEAQSSELAHPRKILDFVDDPLWSMSDISKDHVKALAVFELIRADELIENSPVRGEFSNKVAEIFDRLPTQAKLATFPVNPLGRMKITAPTSAEFNEWLNNIGLPSLRQNFAWNEWAALSQFARHFDFGDDVLQQLADISKQWDYSSAEVDELNMLPLFHAAEVAAIQQSEGLANAIASSIFKLAVKANDTHKSDVCFLIVARASAAFISRNSWCVWMQETMASLAYSLPTGMPCVQLLSRLEAIERHLPLRDRVLGQAKKLAAGAR